MRNLIRADLRRVWRKQIYWIFPIGIILLMCSSMSSMLLLHVLVDKFPILALFGKGGHGELRMFVTALAQMHFVMSLLVFLCLFTEDFRSMSMVGMIGYGLSRKKVVISKFIDSVILTSIFYVAIIPIVFLLPAAFGKPLAGDYVMFTILQIFFSALKTITYVSISALVLYVSGNMPLGIFSILVLQIIPIGLNMASQSPLVGLLHLEHYYMDGLYNMAMANFMLGLVPEGIGVTLIGIVVYIGLILAATILYFDRKELDF